MEPTEVEMDEPSLTCRNHTTDTLGAKHSIFAIFLLGWRWIHIKPHFYTPFPPCLKEHTSQKA